MWHSSQPHMEYKKPYPHVTICVVAPGSSSETTNMRTIFVIQSQKGRQDNRGGRHANARRVGRLFDGGPSTDRILGFSDTAQTIVCPTTLPAATTLLPPSWIHWTKQKKKQHWKQSSEHTQTI